ncbi:MAG: hypothetical protein JXA75_02985, partial [Candidatus Thermoplasmatota archaeon]|nr:hypothetical protein [Candidatus Thermoplasmatota archaeon]
KTYLFLFTLSSRWLSVCLDDLYFLVAQRRLITIRTIIFYNKKSIEFAYGYLFHFFFTYFTVTHSNHFTD